MKKEILEIIEIPHFPHKTELRQIFDYNLITCDGAFVFHTEYLVTEKSTRQ